VLRSGIEHGRRAPCSVALFLVKPVDKTALIDLFHQRRGIGTELIKVTRDRMGPRSMLVLLSAPKASMYYPKISFNRHESAWTLSKADRCPPAWIDG